MVYICRIGLDPWWTIDHVIENEQESEMKNVT